ncbi:hypothetical protein LK540_04570 [Massilia sp. IC2-278]|uniref:hypothetical protein n=1 Tax=Massilia sp. IC2-278 TaxID=2887200 RepID=UPI001E3E736C|nr:hypothetical protein [Massilia sp. IC2-278]MCC2959703.1 hypothetical protein [Massilia sp. IC2-278]
MKKASLLHAHLVLSLSLASGAALADDAAVLKCRTLPDTAQRLACYDAMPVGAAPAAASAATTAAAAAAPVRAAQAPEQQFGIEHRAKEAEPDQIESSIAGDFDGWSGNTTIKLTNGQVWRITDGSQAVLPLMHNPKVRIKRGLFGAAFFFQVDGQNSTARVRRVQ